jgi:sigma-E factor negative regulatory protein RseB
LQSSRLKKRYRLDLLAVLSLCAAAGTAAAACPEADTAALEWLDKMSRSIRQISYQGVVMLQRGDEMQVMQVSHSVDHGSSSERLTQLTGQGAQVERGPHPLNCIHPGDQFLRLDTLVQGDHCGIAGQYRVSVAEDERVAGRNAVRINIEPRDMYRFGYVMALDRETGLLLKTQTISHGHTVLETIQFANIIYTADLPAVGEVDVLHEAQHPHPHPQSPAVNSAVARAWSPAWIPRGFAATDSSLGMPGRRTYTDGLAVFSVFLEDLDRQMRPGEGLVRQGGTTIYTRGMLITGQPVLVTVIGEVPVNTARMVADSVSWVQ